jgi:hypothetical protein
MVSLAPAWPSSFQTSGVIHWSASLTRQSYDLLYTLAGYSQLRMLTVCVPEAYASDVIMYI